MNPILGILIAAALGGFVALEIVLAAWIGGKIGERHDTGRADQNRNQPRGG